MSDNEQWKAVSGFEGLYEISSKGRVRSSRGVKAQYVNRFGYAQITLYKSSKAYPRKIHRLVAGAFLPNLNNKREVNHIDGDKLNNDVSNLEWVTPRENKIHAQRLGLAPKPPMRFGEKSYSAKLTESQVAQIRSEYRRNTPGYGAPTLAKKYGVSARCITYIVNGQHWSGEKMVKDKQI